jgi:hypothetical protein
MKRVGITAIFSLLVMFCQGANYYTCGSGDWSGAIWGTSSSCSLPGITLPALNNGDVLWIDDNITINTNVDISGDNVTIQLSALMTIEAQLRVSQNSTIVFSSSGRVEPTSNGNNDKIRFGNDFVWSGADGPLQGPGTMDENFNPGTSPLPVVLLFFKANIENSSVDLRWATATEINSSHFIVEKSADGISFYEIGQRAAGGTTVVRSDYQFEDSQPFIGNNYYRLKEVDIDGYTEYFNIVFVQYFGKKSLQISPNPYNGGDASISLNFLPEQNSIAVITDLSGKEITRFAFSGSIHKAPLKINAGTYVVKVYSGSERHVSRLVVE